MLDRAFATFKKTTGRPTLIIVDSHIGYGAPTKQDTHAAHGEPLGEEEIRADRSASTAGRRTRSSSSPTACASTSPPASARAARSCAPSGWRWFDAYKAKYPKEADALFRMQHRQLPDGWEQAIPTFPADAKGLAGRDASAKVLNAVARTIPWLIGGSADLAPSTKTRLTFDGAGDFEAGKYGGRNFHFGIREHAMGAILNGLSLSKIRPYGSGFLIFSDYGRAPIRLAAIMEIPVIYVFTHDSIGVGEDGPTHQPVEQLLSLRAIPGLITIRPGDANEVAEAWRVITRPPARAGRADPHAPGAADARPHEVRARLRARQGRLRARRRPRRQPRGAPHRHRQRSRRSASTAHEHACEGRHPQPRRQHAVVGAVRRSAGRVPGSTCCRRRSRRASPSSRRRRSAGTAMSGPAVA